MKSQVVKMNEVKQPFAWFSVAGVIFIHIISFSLCWRTYDVSEEFHLRKSLQRVNEEAYLIKMNERDDDNVENCVKRPNFNINKTQ